MKRSVFFLCLILISLQGIAQNKKKKASDLYMEKEVWSEGTIALNEGGELKGLIRFNDKNGVLSFQDGTDSRVFTPRSVSGFQFFDEAHQKQRFFYTFDFEDEETNVVRPQFFEVVREFKKFALLLRTDRLQFDVKTSGGNYAGGLYTGTTSYTELSQTSTFFLMNTKGEIEPYLKVTNIETDGAWWRESKSSKVKVIEEDLLVKYIGQPVFDKLKDYAKSNNLKFRKKDDFVKIMEYYQVNFDE